VVKTLVRRVGSQALSSAAVNRLGRPCCQVTRTSFRPTRAQRGNSLNPRPLRIMGTHFSTRAALVFACFADETCMMYDFLRPGVSIANADLRSALSSSRLCNSSGIGYSEGFLISTFFPDSSSSMAS
jgi:hypothetical protein